MIIRVANPIYDSVFKFLMEDERIARTVISALLKKEVVEVQIRRNEYTNGYRDNISMFRIDFGSRVRQHFGSLRLVLTELQKTWLTNQGTERAAVTAKLETLTAKPETLTAEPATLTERPATVTAKPATLTVEPATGPYTRKVATAGIVG